jgi:hypothetical protein
VSQNGADISVPLGHLPSHMCPSSGRTGGRGNRPSGNNGGGVCVHSPRIIYNILVSNISQISYKQ